MKKTILALAATAALLSACGTDTTTRETVIHDRPVVMQQPATTTVVTPSVNCPHGYDASTNSCY